MDFTVKITSNGDFQWYTGLESLNSSASDSTITLSYSQVSGMQPEVSVMADAFANSGETGTIPLQAFKYEEAAAEALQELGSAAFADGTSNRPDGLAIGVDSTGTIGGQARATYANLASTETASGGTLTLAKLATLDSAISSGTDLDAANINVSTFTIFDLYEQLQTPTTRQDINRAGYDVLGIGGDQITKPGNIGTNAGFTVLAHRGTPLLRDKAATAQTWYKLNERTFGWYGRTIVPDEYKGKIEKVNMGSMKAFEGTGADTMPSEYNGWFYQPSMMLPNQAGTIARFHIYGQICWKEPRRNGKLTGVTGV